MTRSKSGDAPAPSSSKSPVASGKVTKAATPVLKKRRSSSSLHDIPEVATPMETDPPAPSEPVTPVPSGSGVPAPSAASEVSPPVPTRPPSPASPSPGVSYATAASGSAAAPVISLDESAAGTTTSSSTQSAAAPKAQSGAKGVKRPLQVPNWRIGAPMFQAANWESIMRPPPSSRMIMLCSRP